MPLQYDDIPGSWGIYSEGWPETPYTTGKLLLCSKTDLVPYGSYVVVGTKYVRSESYPYHQVLDYSDAVIRLETENLKHRLEEAYEGMFVVCRDLLLREEFRIKKDRTW